MPLTTLPADAWRKIDGFLKDRTLIPVLGRGAITFGEDDQPLYPWLIQQVAERHRISSAPQTLHLLVCAYVKEKQSSIEEAIEEICLDLDDLLNTKHRPKPGPLMRTIASLAQLRAIFTLGCDTLLEDALSEVRGFNRERWVFAPDLTPVDLPPLPKGDTINPVLGYLFGKASASPGFQLWDADTVEFVHQLQRSLPTLSNLGAVFAQNHFLFIGADLTDWAMRFLLRVIRNRPLIESSRRSWLMLDGDPPHDAQSVVFFDSLKRGMTVIQADPIAFAREFCAHALAQQPALTSGTLPGATAHLPLMDTITPDGSVFISYAHVDAIAAFEVVTRLREKGCDVWLDRDRLSCGDDFENNLSKAVKMQCGFFVSLISNTTESKTESYYHKERNWAAERSQSMVGHARPFFFPVIIDDTPHPIQHEPKAFCTKDAERAPAGQISEALAVKLAELQRRLRTPLV
jgi:hypothetical protein